MDDRSRYARIALCIAAFLYAAFSSPSPDAPGVVEIIIIALLVLACLGGGFALKPDWAKPLAVLFLYGLSVPLLVGILAGAASGDILRDMVAFGALGLPILLGGLFVRDGRMLLYVLLGIGMAFALRYLSMPDMVLVSLASGPFDDRLLYLANSPLVFFAALWLLLQGSFAENKLPRAVLFITLSLIPIAAMAGMMQRATLGLLILAWIGGLAFTLVHRPQRGVVMLMIASIGVVCVWPIAGDLVHGLILKTQMVGWNARAQEWAAVFAQINQDPLSALFGRGWGALMQSPAVADQWVRFSHSLLSSMLWKAGWVGLVLAIVAMGTLTIIVLRRLQADAVTVSALVLALIPACFLYGSYKSLCFGLLLTGLAVLRLDKTPPAVLPSPGENESR